MKRKEKVWEPPKAYFTSKEISEYGCGVELCVIRFSIPSFSSKVLKTSVIRNNCGHGGEVTHSDMRFRYVFYNWVWYTRLGAIRIKGRARLSNIVEGGDA